MIALHKKQRENNLQDFYMRPVLPDSDWTTSENYSSHLLNNIIIILLSLENPDLLL